MNLQANIRMLLPVMTLLCGAVSHAKVTESVWRRDIASGEWEADGNWSQPGWPEGRDTAAAFYGNSNHNALETTVWLADVTNKINRLHVLHYNPSSFTFDGRGRTFSVGALDEGDFKRGLNTDGGSFYPFRIMAESASSSSAAGLYTSGSGREPVLNWTNALLHTSSGAFKDVSIEFLSGFFDFDVENLGKWKFSFAGDALSKVTMTISNAVVKVNEFNAALAATNSSITVGEGGILQFSEKFSYGYNSNFAYPGTNTLTVKDGGRIVFDNGEEKINSSAFYAGTMQQICRRQEIEITGDGSSMDLRKLGSAYFQGNSLLLVKNGAELILPGVIGFSFAANANIFPLSELHISGDDTRVCISTNLATAGASSGCLTLGAVADVSNRVVMTGGSLAPLYPGGYGALSIKIASAPAGDALFDLRGGEVDLWVPNCQNPATACYVRIGPGDGELHVSGGSLNSGDIYVGANQDGNATEGRIKHKQCFRMTGGEVTCNRLYLGNHAVGNSTFQYQNARVVLDGGVLCTSQAFVNYPSYQNEDGYIGTLYANGGTLKAKANSYTLLKGFDTAELGPKGLTIDTSGFDKLTVTQSLSDKSGEKGLLRFTGGGIITLAPDRYYTVATTAVEQATIMAVKTNMTLHTALVFNGGSVSLVGEADELTVDSLIGKSGTLIVDPQDTVRITTSNFEVENLTMKFQSVPTLGENYQIFSFDGDVSDNAQLLLNLRRLRFANVPSGCYGAYSLVYDETTGRTSAQVRLSAPSAPLGDETATIWQGAGWNDDGWSQGMPDSGKAAVFTDASAPEAVTVPSGAQVGALKFSSGLSHTFTGSALQISGFRGASFIDVASAVQTFDVPLVFWYSLPVNVAEGAALVFNAPLSEGGFVKTGKGRLAMSAGNDFRQPVTLGGGLNEILAPGAVGSHGQSTTLTEDTLVFSNSVDGAEMTVDAPLVLKSPHSPTNALVVKTDTDTVFTGFKVDSGSFIKRGTGTMTILSTVEKSPSFNGGYGVGQGSNSILSDSTAAISFAADGSAPMVKDHQYGGFNVAEGDLTIRAEPDAPVFNLKTAVFVGLEVAGDPENFIQPSLTVDGAKLSHNGGSGHWVVGHHVAKPGNAVTRPLLRIVNGGSISCGNLRVGENSNFSGAFPTVAVTGSTVKAVNALRFSCAGTAGKQAAVLRVKDSVFVVTGTGGSHHGIAFGGHIDADFDNTFFGGLNQAGKIILQNASYGEVRFRNGSVFSVGTFEQSTSSANNTFNFVFDDAEWRWGGGDYKFIRLASDEHGTFTGLRSTRHIILRGRGLVLKPDDGATFETEVKFEGDGCLVCDGPGTVKLSGESHAFTGMLEICQGTVDLSASTVSPDSLTVKGPGTLNGGNIGVLTVKVSCKDGVFSGAPVLNGTVARQVVVDFGADSASALPLDECSDILVARLSGASLPDAEKWKVVGTGHEHLLKTFSVAGGEVRLSIRKRKPLNIIIR